MQLTDPFMIYHKYRRLIPEGTSKDGIVWVNFVSSKSWNDIRTGVGVAFSLVGHAYVTV